MAREIEEHKGHKGTWEGIRTEYRCREGDEQDGGEDKKTALRKRDDPRRCSDKPRGVRIMLQR